MSLRPILVICHNGRPVCVKLLQYLAGFAWFGLKDHYPVMIKPYQSRQFFMKTDGESTVLDSIILCFRWRLVVCLLARPSLCLIWLLVC